LTTERGSTGAAAGDVRALREVFRNPDLRRIEVASLATAFAEWGSSLALGIYAYGEGGPSAVGSWDSSARCRARRSPRP
jgi:hypothetical protein